MTNSRSYFQELVSGGFSSSSWNASHSSSCFSFSSSFRVFFSLLTWKIQKHHPLLQNYKASLHMTCRSWKKRIHQSNEQRGKSHPHRWVDALRQFSSSTSVQTRYGWQGRHLWLGEDTSRSLKVLHDYLACQHKTKCPYLVFRVSPLKDKKGVINGDCPKWLCFFVRYSIHCCLPFFLLLQGTVFFWRES